MKDAEKGNSTVMYAYILTSCSSCAGDRFTMSRL
jgi:hypothetical protein